MNYDDAKEDALRTLSAALDQTSREVRSAFVGRGITTQVRRVDYVAQVIVLTFPDQQPSTDLIDVIGEEVRSVWPEMPQVTATFFKVSNANADLILDLNAPSGIAKLVEEGDIKSIIAIADGTDVLKV